MEVIHLKYPHQLQQRESIQPYSLAIGFFDGVHIGHQAVIEAVKQEGGKRQIPTAVMTFDPHPSLVLGGRNEKVFYITLLQQKLQLFEELGVDTVFVVHFTSDFAKLSPAAFIDTFIRGLNIQHVTAGFDFSFGAFGKGTMEDMRILSNGEYGVTVVDKKADSLEKISSTRIRKVLQEGDMEAARMLLGTVHLK